MNILPDELTYGNANAHGGDGLTANEGQWHQIQIREPEKFINKALNIAGLYTLKHRQPILNWQLKDQMWNFTITN